MVHVRWTGKKTRRGALFFILVPVTFPILIGAINTAGKVSA
jgi:hypothetical protein